MLKFWCSFGFLPLAQDSNKSSTQLCSGNQGLTCSLSFLVMTPRINPSRCVIKLGPSRLAGTQLPQVFQKASLPTGQLYQPFRSLSVLWPQKTKRLCTSKPFCQIHVISSTFEIGCRLDVIPPYLRLQPPKEGCLLEPTVNQANREPPSTSQGSLRDEKDWGVLQHPTKLGKTRLGCHHILCRCLWSTYPTSAPVLPSSTQHASKACCKQICQTLWEMRRSKAHLEWCVRASHDLPKSKRQQESV